MLRVLAPLSDDPRIILVGGQAVAWWARYLKPKDRDLPLANALTSKDIDFEGSLRAVYAAGRLLEADVRVPDIDHHTPETGVVVFTDRDGIEREIDFIDQPQGLRAQDVRNTAVQMEVPGRGRQGATPFWVMHPERCMESRIYNVETLPGKDSQLGLDQLAVSIACARDWTVWLLEQDELDPDVRRRAGLKLNERIFHRCEKDRAFRNVYLGYDLDPFEAVVHDHPMLPDQFRARRYPQMLERVDERRRADRRNRERAKRRAAQGRPR